MTTDIDAIRQRAERYSQTGIGSGKTIQAIDLANKDVPALLAKVDELTAERDDLAAYNRAVKGANADLRAALAEREAQLTAANRRNDGLQADLDSATKANTAWSNETAAKDAVIEAAKTWRRAVAETGDYEISDSDVLIAAIDALPKPSEVAR